MKKAPLHMKICFVIGMLQIFFIKTISSQSTEFYPLNVGNYWVYSNSGSNTIDTLKIIKAETYNMDTVYIFSNGQKLLAHGDTIFEMQSQRPRVEFPALQFYPADEGRFSHLIGGDVISVRVVRKLKEGKCKVGAVSYSSCYEFSGIQIITISRGVGVIEVFNREPYSLRTLVSYHLENNKGR